MSENKQIKINDDLNLLSIDISKYVFDIVEIEENFEHETVGVKLVARLNDEKSKISDVEAEISKFLDDYYFGIKR